MNIGGAVLLIFGFLGAYAIALILADGVISLKHKLEGTPMARDLAKAHEKTIEAQAETISKQKDYIRAQNVHIKQLNRRIKELENGKDLPT